MSIFSLPGWEYHPPKFEEKLQYLSNYKIEKTGMSREKLHKLLTFLYEEGIID